MSVASPFLQKKPNIIVGMGPGGLVAALELAKAGQNVLILENRDYFTRGQRVHLDDSIVAYLTDLVKDDGEAGLRFIDFIKNEGNIVEISNLQHYLREKLNQYPGIKIKQGKHIQVKAVNLTDNNLQYTENGKEHTVPFQHLIAADGARHSTATLAGKGRKGHDFVDYKIQPRQEAHGTVHVELGENVAIRQKKRHLNNSDLEALQKCGWDKPYLPRLYIWPDSTGRKFYIAGEVPEIYLKLKGESLQKSLENWAKVILKRTYEYQENELGLNLYAGSNPVEKEKDKLKTTAFSVTLEHAVASAHDCNQKDPSNHVEHAFIQIGDASRSANFHLGHGTNDAIRDGIAVAKHLNKNDNTFNIAALNADHKAIKEKVEYETKSYLYWDKQAYKDLKDSHYKEQILEMAENIKVNILSSLKRSERRLIEKQFKEIKKLLNKEKYNDVLLLSEDIFNNIHEKLLDNAEHFSKPLNTKKLDNFFRNVFAWFGSFNKASKKQGQKTFIDDKAMEQKIKHKSAILHHFRNSAESLAKLKELENLELGKRLSVVKPNQTKSSFKK